MSIRTCVYARLRSKILRNLHERRNLHDLMPASPGRNFLASCVLLQGVETPPAVTPCAKVAAVIAGAGGGKTLSRNQC